MPLLIGIILAAAVALFAQLTGFDRDRAFYPTVLIVVGAFYVLFAVMAGGGGLATELLFFAIFAALAVAGFKSSLWIAAAGLALHGLFDWVRHAFLPGSGVPTFWPAFCGSYDVAAAIILAVLLLTDRRRGAADRT
jgi:hypothetical protein